MMCKFFLIFILCLFVKNGLGEQKYTYGNEDEYLYSYPMKRNWFLASRYCSYFGYKLVEVSSSKIHQHVLTIVSEPIYANVTSRGFWTAGTDLGSEGSFYWANSGQGFVFSDFSPGQPDNAGGNENCIEIRHEFGFKFNDHGCLEEKYFICHKTINQSQFI